MAAAALANVELPAQAKPPAEVAAQDDTSIVPADKQVSQEGSDTTCPLI